MNIEFELLIDDAETLERAADIIRRERTKRTFMVDVLLRVLTDVAASLRSQARKLDREPRAKTS